MIWLVRFVLCQFVSLRLFYWIPHNYLRTLVCYSSLTRLLSYYPHLGSVDLLSASLSCGWDSCAYQDTQQLSPSSHMLKLITHNGTSVMFLLNSYIEDSPAQQTHFIFPTQHKSRGTQGCWLQLSQFIKSMAQTSHDIETQHCFTLIEKPHNVHCTYLKSVVV